MMTQQNVLLKKTNLEAEFVGRFSTLPTSTVANTVIVSLELYAPITVPTLDTR